MLTLTLGGPVAREPTRDDFEVLLARRGELEHCERGTFTVRPEFLAMQTADEPNERSTIFIVGDFTRRPEV